MNAYEFIVAETNPDEFSLPFLLAVVFATAMVVMSTRRRMRRNSNRPTSRAGKATRSSRIQQRAETHRAGKSIESQASSAMLELQEYARQIQGQIDNRLQKLEIASRHADEKIAEFRRLIGDGHSVNAPIAPQTTEEPGESPTRHPQEIFATDR